MKMTRPMKVSTFIDVFIGDSRHFQILLTIPYILFYGVNETMFLTKLITFRNYHHTFCMLRYEFNSLDFSVSLKEG
jgi:hypothetical protein